MGYKRERRRWERLQIQVPVRAFHRQMHNTLAVDGWATELSESGMALLAEVELEIGETVEIEFAPVYSNRMRIRAQVRTQSGHTYGLEFLTGDVNERLQVAMFKRMLTAAAGRLLAR